MLFSARDTIGILKYHIAMFL